MAPKTRSASATEDDVHATLRFTGDTRARDSGFRSSDRAGAERDSGTAASVAIRRADITKGATGKILLCCSTSEDSDIKFSLNSLMSVLRDSRHEGWVLAAYPDPKTSRPLIGAGFGLNVSATEHPQPADPLNPHPFVEPSTAELWQAVGTYSATLQAILDEFDRDLATWKKKNFRKKIRIHALSPQITEDDATKLLRISAIQATYNARLLPLLRPVHRVAADGVKPACLSDGHKS